MRERPEGTRRERGGGAALRRNAGGTGQHPAVRARHPLRALRLLQGHPGGEGALPALGGGGGHGAGGESRREPRRNAPPCAPPGGGARLRRPGGTCQAEARAGSGAAGAGQRTKRRAAVAAAPGPPGSSGGGFAAAARLRGQRLSREPLWPRGCAAWPHREAGGAFGYVECEKIVKKILTVLGSLVTPSNIFFSLN